ncbi:MAG: hypothetical protein C4527_06795 [Candidatus Omnitrophota bacterium]|nr:MAG: hypothetical protein C4527_06795 [Candidatus Omnitrophota bacterium]
MIKSQHRIKIPQRQAILLRGNRMEWEEKRCRQVQDWEVSDLFAGHVHDSIMFFIQIWLFPRSGGQDARAPIFSSLPAFSG